MAIYGNFVHFVGFTMRKQKDRPKGREPPSQRPTKILSSYGQAQHEILAKNSPCVQIDPAGEIPSILPSTREHLKKQPNSQTKLEVGHLSHLPFLT